MGEVPEAQGDAAEVFESAVDGLTRAVRGPRVVEVGQDVGGPFLQGVAQGGHFGQCGGDFGGDRVDQMSHDRPTLGTVFGAVGGHDLLVDGPGHLDRGVGVIGEHSVEAGGLPVGEQVPARVQGQPDPEQGVAPAAPMARGVLLDALAGDIELVAGELDDVEGVHHLDRGWQFLGGCGLEAGEPVHGHHLDAVAPGLVAAGQPGFEDLLGAARHHVEQPGGPGAVA